MLMVRILRVNDDDENKIRNVVVTSVLNMFQQKRISVSLAEEYQFGLPKSISLIC